MSSIFIKDESIHELYFKNVNGLKLKLIDKSAKGKHIIQFILHKNVCVNFNVILLFIFATWLLWKAFNVFIPFVASILILIIQFISFIGSINEDTLTVVESIGIYTDGKGIFYSSCAFIPWDAIIDIFINEVITGQRVLYYLTIIVKESFDDKDSIKEEMPGIYIRKASWIDWSQTGDSPGLTVPGSYWFCHKQNIYKFIFRYHRASRNIKQFNCIKELLKVIRKIIKNPPQQGQQFGTNHLLITFNRIAWARQDKMFALMQFKERSVSAFSHAFVLNIKMFHPVEVGQNAKCTIACPYSVQSLFDNENEDINDTHDYENENDKSSKKCSVNSSKDNFSNKSNHCDNIQEHAIESKSINNQLNNTLINSNLKELFITKEPVGETDSNKNASKLVEQLDVSFKLPTAPENIKLTNKIMENNDNRLEASCVNDKGKSGEHKIGKDCAASKTTSLSSNNGMLNDNSIFDDTNVDSANLPYQYLIEKEIENAKQNIRKRGLAEKSERGSTKDIEMNSDTIKTPDAFCSKKKKFALGNVARSSNITDLVMEGLMFTICQGPHAVAVIEQKTKLKIDEVLENSEKIEMKEGGKCLRNSSLLGLENLITMIELPKNGEHENKCQNIGKNPTLRNQFVNKHLYDIKYSVTNNKREERNIASEVGHRQLQSPCNSSMLASTSFSNNSGINTVDKDNYSETYDNPKFSESITFSGIEDLNYKEDKYDEDGGKDEEAEEEEDIIPEALQNEMYQPSLLSFKIDKSEEPLKSMPNKDFLMDDIHNKKLMKSEKIENQSHTSFGKTLQSTIYLNHDCSNDDLHLKSGKVASNSSMNEIHHDTIHESNLKYTKNLKSNCPLVLSDQIVTLNQIPLPVQAIIRNRLSMKRTLLNNNNETSVDNININKTGPCKEQDNVINVQLNNQIGENLLRNVQHQQHHDLANNNIGTYNETTASTRSQVKLEENNISVNNITLKVQESQKQYNCTENVEKLSSSKITDITQQFYHDLSCFQRKGNLINQKHLRRSQTSLNLYNENNNLLNGNNSESDIQMVKLFQDITRGAKVVVKRISINKYS